MFWTIFKRPKVTQHKIGLKIWVITSKLLIFNENFFCTFWSRLKLTKYISYKYILIIIFIVTLRYLKWGESRLPFLFLFSLLRINDAKWNRVAFYINKDGLGVSAAPRCLKLAPDCLFYFFKLCHVGLCWNQNPQTQTLILVYLFIHLIHS